jgi:hypothetical protein
VTELSARCLAAAATVQDSAAASVCSTYTGDVGPQQSPQTRAVAVQALALCQSMTADLHGIMALPAGDVIAEVGPGAHLVCTWGPADNSLFSVAFGNDDPPGASSGVTLPDGSVMEQGVTALGGHHTWTRIWGDKSWAVVSLDPTRNVDKSGSDQAWALVNKLHTLV